MCVSDGEPDPDPDTEVATCFACHLVGTVLELRGHCFLCQEMFCDDCSKYDPNPISTPDEDAIYCHACIQTHGIVILAQDGND